MATASERRNNVRDDSVCVTDANVLAAKQIASIAARNPYVISDCSDILV